jgi:hypothetical protein
MSFADEKTGCLVKANPACPGKKYLCPRMKVSEVAVGPGRTTDRLTV